MPIIGRPRRAAYRRPQARQYVGQLGMTQHAVLEAEIAGLALHLRHHRAALRHFALAEAELDAALLLQPDVDPGALAEPGGKQRPRRRRRSRPALIMRRADPLGLHPDEAEIAARGPIGNIALVEDDDSEPGIGEAVADRGADQPAAD